MGLPVWWGKAGVHRGHADTVHSGTCVCARPHVGLHPACVERGDCKAEPREGRISMTEAEERYCWQGDKLELGGWLWKKARVLWQLFLWGRSVSRAGLLGGL